MGISLSVLVFLCLLMYAKRNGHDGVTEWIKRSDDIEGKRMLVCDDVVETGRTLQGVAKTICDSGTPVVIDAFVYYAYQRLTIKKRTELRQQKGRIVPIPVEDIEVPGIDRILSL